MIMLYEKNILNIVWRRNLDMNEKTNQITKKFLNKELANEINAYPNSFGGNQKINTATFFDN